MGGAASINDLRQLSSRQISQEVRSLGPDFDIYADQTFESGISGNLLADVTGRGHNEVEGLLLNDLKISNPNHRSTLLTRLIGLARKSSTKDQYEDAAEDCGTLVSSEENKAATLRIITSPEICLYSTNADNPGSLPTYSTNKRPIDNVITATGADKVHILTENIRIPYEELLGEQNDQEEEHYIKINQAITDVITHVMNDSSALSAIATSETFSFHLLSALKCSMNSHEVCMKALAVIHLMCVYRQRPNIEAISILLSAGIAEVVVAIINRRTMDFEAVSEVSYRLLPLYRLMCITSLHRRIPYH
jgi:hypothetical protein